MLAIFFSSTMIEFFSTKVIFEEFTPLSLKEGFTFLQNTLLLFFVKVLGKDCVDTYINTSFHSSYFCQRCFRVQIASLYYLLSKVFCHKWIIMSQKLLFLRAHAYSVLLKNTASNSPQLSLFTFSSSIFKVFLKLLTSNVLQD